MTNENMNVTGNEECSPDSLEQKVNAGSIEQDWALQVLILEEETENVLFQEMRGMSFSII